MSLRWGILGAGYVARKFVFGLRQSDGGRPVLAHSRNRGRCRDFAISLGIPLFSDDLEDSVNRNDVDIFYVATPPACHRAHALACLTAGKPVVVEKPFATTLADAEAIVAAARARRLFCMEGMWTRFLPLATELKALVDSGKIGALRGFVGGFGMSNLPDSAQSLFNRSQGGGALLHRGVYPLAMALDLCGPATLAGSVATMGETGVDEDCALTLRHDNGVISTIRASLRAQLATEATLEGTHGAIRIEPPIYRPFRLTMTRIAPRTRGLSRAGRWDAIRESAIAQLANQWLGGVAGAPPGANTRRITRNYAGNGYNYEADEAMRCLAAGRAESARMPWRESLAMVAITEAARRTWEEEARQP